MDLRKSDIRALQIALKERGIYAGLIDGLAGPMTVSAAKAVNAAQSNLLPDGHGDWPNNRTVTASYQIILTEAGQNPGPIDGYYGPLTRNASVWFIRDQQGIVTTDFEDLAPQDVNPNGFPKETTAALNSFYGHVNPPNSCSVDIVQVPCPWRMGLDWDMSASRNHFNVHKKVADSLKRVLDATFQHYGEATIKKHGLNRFSGDFFQKTSCAGQRMTPHLQP